MPGSVAGISDALRTGLIHRSGVRALSSWAYAIQAWPVGSHIYGQYAERTEIGDVVCRTENVSACHRGVAGLVDGPLRDVASEALGEPAIAFKDKINYKQPGGAGFRPHQDVLAYPGVERVLSILVAIDACSIDSGCLWLAEGVDEVLPTDDRGVVRDDVVTTLSWRPIEMEPGDAVFLDGFAPHYSEANTSSHPRRVLVASYAPEREGYTRAMYYEARGHAMSHATEQDGRFRISTLADFAGEQVPDAEAAADRCTHG